MFFFFFRFLLFQILIKALQVFKKQFNMLDILVAKLWSKAWLIFHKYCILCISDDTNIFRKYDLIINFTHNVRTSAVQ